QTQLQEASRRPQEAREEETSVQQVVSRPQETSAVQRDHSGPHWRSGVSLRVASPSGLPNLGNTCYINVIVQCLFNINSLRDYCIRDSYRRDINQSSEQRGEVVSAVAQLFKALHSGLEKDVKDKVQLLKHVIGAHGDQYRGTQHRDAHDLLADLLRWLHNDLVNAAGSSLVSRRLRGENNVVTVCERCGKEVSRATDIFTILSLPVAPSRMCSLQDLIRTFYRRQKVDRECSQCRRLNTCHRDKFITLLPPVLIIHLRRYSSADERERRTWVTFPADGLSLQDHTHANYHSPTYELFAVVNHEGPISSGHYTTFCRNQHGKTWRLYDDLRVSETDLETVLEESQAQILFYTEMKQSVRI
ncbi:hypothetical protein OTU49_009844, partial [Cherax quadricarinatus]